MSYSELETVQALYRENFDAFAFRAFSVIEPGAAYHWNWHIGCIAEHLEAVHRGEIPKLIINLPFRSLKSYLVSVAFPAWVLGKDPTQKFITATYGSDLAKDLSQRCRDIVKDDWYRSIFPTKVNPNQDEKMDWHTTQHGYYYATGMSGTVTGKGADYLILDDPLKPDEAYSQTVRESTIKLIRNTLFSRFNDPRKSKFIMIMQRLHEEDPTGDLLKDGGYHLLKLPGEAKFPVTISLGPKRWDMEPGDLLFPERLTPDVLARFRLDMTELNYSAQIQQEPIPVGGGEFKPDDWLQYYQVGGVKPKEHNLFIIVDPSGGEALNKKKKKSGDWTVMDVIGSAPDNNYYLHDRIRDRLNPTERVDTLFMLHRKWNELTGKPPKVGYEKYSMQSDVHYIKEKQRQDAYNFPIIELGGKVMKEERIRRLIPDMQKGRWYFPATLAYVDIEGRKFDLVAEMIDEMRTFPHSKYDDILDTMSRVYEPELHLTFPRAKGTMTSKALRSAREGPRHESWENF